ncbi:hypothetical protein SERLA73DRAFT_149125 [Serpula lacrymans var. lacrymans S7.3]|uniref:Uncharacterized protein n=1 Tax=Serpula lacrymans var. lacrymans (strain S7.3) TaxID=936435 RepID=F8PFF8_SERL3|nr:hypothetical protein SERLA73DRAFT_149125 [Serpula lacrymans var. lacrymans S7.3]
MSSNPWLCHWEYAKILFGKMGISPGSHKHIGTSPGVIFVKTGTSLVLTHRKIGISLGKYQTHRDISGDNIWEHGEDGDTPGDNIWEYGDILGIDSGKIGISLGITFGKMGISDILTFGKMGTSPGIAFGKIGTSHGPTLGMMETSPGIIFGKMGTPTGIKYENIGLFLGKSQTYSDIPEHDLWVYGDIPWEVPEMYRYPFY